MSHPTEFQLLTLTGIVHRCARETERFFQRQEFDSRYCFELFRRAIVHRNQRGWELIYAQYSPQVAGWVEHHSAFPDSGEEIQYFINRTFEKMWNAMTPDKFSNFSDLGSLLSYMRMCVNSVICDHVRRVKYLGTDFRDEISPNYSPDSRVGDYALDVVHQQEIWDAVATRMRNEQEWHAVYGTFVLDLKPKKICAWFPEMFADAKEVYRVKENALSRLGRDDEFLKLLGPDT